MVVVACNSAATVMSKAENIPYSDSEIVEVISPIVQLIASQDKYRNIGIIGTRKTIGSGMFNKQLEKLNPSLNIIAKATPLLVPLIEEGFIQNEILFPVFNSYLKDFKDCELIIPACTHYPIIYEQIESYFNNGLKVLHTPKIVAEKVLDHLNKSKLLNKSDATKADEFHLSDITEEFVNEAQLFLGRPIKFQKTLLN
jgi:glutamate racemase